MQLKFAFNPIMLEVAAKQPMNERQECLAKSVAHCIDIDTGSVVIGEQSQLKLAERETLKHYSVMLHLCSMLEIPGVRQRRKWK